MYVHPERSRRHINSASPSVSCGTLTSFQCNMEAATIAVATATCSLQLHLQLHLIVA